MDKIKDLMKELKDKQNNIEPLTPKEAMKEMFKEMLDSGYTIEEIMSEDFQNKLWEQYKKEVDILKSTLQLKSWVYDYQIKTQYSPNNWRMKLMERVLNATLISIFQTFNKYKPEEEWSFNTDCCDAWKNEYEIMLDYVGYYEHPEESQYNKLTQKIRDNMIKISNGELIVKDFGEGMPLEGGAGTHFSGKKGMQVDGAYCSKYNSFDWRNTAMGTLITDMVENIVINISKYKDTMKFSDKLQLENSEEHIEEIINDYTKKELKNLFRVVRKALIKSYNYE